MKLLLSWKLQVFKFVTFLNEFVISVNQKQKDMGTENNILNSIEIVFSNEKLLSEFRKKYATEKDFVLASAKDGLLKKDAKSLINKLAQSL